jgi:TolB protein
VEIETGATRVLVSNGWGNINLPGSAWNDKTDKIVFASTRDPHDEIYMIDGDGTAGTETQITSRTAYVAYEPSFSPDGDWIVFESHLLDVEGNGVIYKCTVTGIKPYTPLTAGSDDCRQPNWAPAGNRILYQKLFNNRWDIYVIDIDGSKAEKITTGPGDKTDASFSPDGEHIIYSSDEGGEEFANLYTIPVSGGSSVKITGYPTGYDGAPSWSPNGSKIAFESCEGDPDESGGTSIWIIRFQGAALYLSRDNLNFAFISGSTVPVSQTFAVSSSGSETLNWEVLEDSPWLLCTPGSGSHSGSVTAAVDPTGLAVGRYSR